jgi:hypothetical protein
VFHGSGAVCMVPYTPELQRVAITVRATMCERTWSAFRHIHTASCNRMKAEEAADMTFVHWRFRMQDQLEDGRKGIALLFSKSH